MTTYFTSKAPSRAAKKGSAPSLADCNFQLGDEDPHTQVQRLPLKNKQAKQALLARHAAEAHKWLLPLRCKPGPCTKTSAAKLAPSEP